MELTLKNRVAVISGASGLVGYEIVQQFLRSGMNVGTLHSRRAKALMVNDWLKEYDDCYFSLSIEETNRISKFNSRFGGIDVLVIGQGWPPVSHEIEEISPEYWHSVIQSNLTRSFQLVQESLPYLRKSSAPRIIYLVSSEARTGAEYDGIPYSTAKGGLISLTFSLARALAPNGITVNAVAMGGIYNKPYPVGDGDQNEQFADYSGLVEKIPLGRLAKPEDVSAAVCFLASEEASFITGEILNVNGGLAMG